MNALAFLYNLLLNFNYVQLKDKQFVILMLIIDLYSAKTGFACMTYFLFINGHVCVMNEKKAADLTVDFVVGKLTFEEVAKIIKEHSYRKSAQS